MTGDGVIILAENLDSAVVNRDMEIGQTGGRRIGAVEKREVVELEPISEINFLPGIG